MGTQECEVAQDTALKFASAAAAKNPEFLYPASAANLHDRGLRGLNGRGGEGGDGNGRGGRCGGESEAHAVPTPRVDRHSPRAQGVRAQGAVSPHAALSSMSASLSAFPSASLAPSVTPSPFVSHSLSGPRGVLCFSWLCFSCASDLLRCLSPPPLSLFLFDSSSPSLFCDLVTTLPPTLSRLQSVSLCVCVHALPLSLFGSLVLLLFCSRARCVVARAGALVCALVCALPPLCVCVCVYLEEKDQAPEASGAVSGASSRAV